ncbi:low temperature requirement protein A, partial [Frankia sp. AgB1.9]|uniref:low temperature requirement protein A n=1 Tax=Frankia sp. AgB1.9 TaxID=1836968 RepID=UPI001931A694
MTFAARDPVEGEPPARVSTIELFFDLVFVFTITQVTQVIVRSPDAGGVGRAAVELWIVFWMYAAFAWLTNTHDPDTPVRRAVVLLGMAAFFVVALAVPTALEPGAAAGGTLTFGLAYLAVVLVHAAGFLLFRGRAAIRQAARFLPPNLVAAGLVLGSAALPSDARVWPWLAAGLVQGVSPFFIGLGANFEINATHFGERHGLVILIVLGESLIGVALASESEPVAGHLVVGALVGLLVPTAMWWLYFGGDDDRAVDAMAAASPRQRPVWAITGYSFAHYVMIFGVLLFAAGTHGSAGELLHRGGPPPGGGAGGGGGGRVGGGGFGGGGGRSPAPPPPNDAPG